MKLDLKRIMTKVFKNGFKHEVQQEIQQDEDVVYWWEISVAPSTSVGLYLTICHLKLLISMWFCEGMHSLEGGWSSIKLQHLKNKKDSERKFSRTNGLSNV